VFANANAIDFGKTNVFHGMSNGFSLGIEERV
jgi:hypothetical protein